ncbi:MAG TPA: PAAR-like domain-containing protein [Planctomycetota bacterium]|nr:PAAR-like domain-containing protein [Planctomycetota bacterium]
MFPASSIAGGQCMGVPDVCLTPAPPAPPVPIPYPNIAMLPQANPGTASSKVLISSAPAFHEGTTIMMSSGDEAGVLGGVISGVFIGPAAPKLASTQVKAEGQGIVYVTCMFGQNGTNPNVPAGLQVAPSQAKVLVAP